MVTAKFTENVNTVIAYGLTQWDFGQDLKILGLNLPFAVQIHFAIGNDLARIEVGDTKDGITTVRVPDQYLQQSTPIKAFIYIVDTEQGETVKTINMPINARQKPADYTSPEYNAMFDEVMQELNTVNTNVNAQAVKATEQSKISTEQAVISTEKASAAGLSENNAKTSETNAKASEDNAKTSETNAKASEDNSSQNLADLLAMMGINIATLTNGKLTPSQVPDISINNSFLINSVDELITLNAQVGDMAYMENADGVVTDLYWLVGNDSTVISNWKQLGLSFVPNAGHSNTSDTANNSNMINGHRMVEMTAEQFELAVKDPNTYYLVG